MNVLTAVNRSIASIIRAAGNAIVTVNVAASTPTDPQPGEDYAPSWTIFGGKGFFEKVNVEDFPDTALQVSDRQLILLQCSYDVDMHDYVRVADDVYHVYGVKPELVGVTRVLQKLLLRVEQKAGIAWESGDLQTA